MGQGGARVTPSLPRVLEPPGANQRIAAWVTFELVVLVPLSALAGGVVVARAALGPLWIILAALYLLLLTAMAYRRLRGISQRAILLAQNARIATGAINAMPDALAVMDARGVYIDANPALCEMTGFAREELLGHAPPYPYWPLESLVQIKQAIADTANGEQPQWETVFMRKNGDRFPVIVNSTRVLGAGGEVFYYVVTFKDVSWIKRAEAALLESEERMRHTMEAALDAVIVIDDRGFVTEWSGSSEQVFGWNAQEIMGVSLADYIVPQGLRAALNQGMAHFRETGQGTVFNKRIELSALHKDGHEFPIELTILPLRLQGKQIFSAFVRDITERELARREIETQQARYRGLYDDNPAMFITLDVHNRIVSINRFGATLLNYEAHDLIGKRLPRLMLKAERRASLQLLGDCRGDPGVTHRWESCLLNSQGDAVWVRVAGRWIEHGDVLPHLLLVCEDNSEARCDPLTGLLSRSGFDRRLRGALASARSKSMQHMLFYIDLDNFKPINDTAGHEAGDAALVEIAELLQQQARKRDSLARLGGDEFALIMEQGPVEQAQRVAEAMRTTLMGYRFHRDGAVFSLSVSIGLVQITAASPNVEQLLHLADEACYAAKAAGKNQVVLK